MTKDDRNLYFRIYYRLHKEKLREYARERYRNRPKTQPISSGFYTKEELFNEDLLPIDEDGRLNKDKWQIIVDKTKEDIENALIEYKLQKEASKERNTITRYVYNSYGQLVANGSAKTLEDKLGISKEQITIYCNKNYFYDGLYFTNVKHHIQEQAIFNINKAKRQQRTKNENSKGKTT